ncbi:hypothetical protein BO86DRAFT_376162 [Aspergillus japonicus CBS 114.51]|uniref:Uncharacterized protein n=1 Tax=Aspergillus japonicus CBS 114.51 TaxID=1448312 RepID=A0A8T8XCS1_ASPJA|nr:hypothetical protein BO86DRAFT_376162 [Aspergillus japonicus CBS 114.51]RAH85851.1 hypothetical protein BO86DRAFT_376162 [Aspergillus japonicus CBS 114.51]
MPHRRENILKTDGSYNHPRDPELHPRKPPPTRHPKTSRSSAGTTGVKVNRWSPKHALHLRPRDISIVPDLLDFDLDVEVCLAEDDGGTSTKTTQSALVSKPIFTEAENPKRDARLTLMLPQLRIPGAPVVYPRDEVQRLQRDSVRGAPQLVLELALRPGAGIPRCRRFSLYRERVRAARIGLLVGEGDLAAGALVDQEAVLGVGQKDGGGSVEEVANVSRSFYHAPLHLHLDHSQSTCAATHSTFSSDGDTKATLFSVKQPEGTDLMAGISLSSVAAYVFIGKTATVAGVLAPDMQKAGACTFIFVSEITSPNAALKDTIQDPQISGATVLLYTDCLSQIDRLKTVLRLWTTDGRRIAGVIYDQTDAAYDDLDDVLYHAAGMQNLHESTAALQLDFSLVYCEKDTPAAAMARRLGCHRSCFRLPFKPLQLESRSWVADAVEAQILTGCRSVFPDPVKAEGLDLHPSPATERLYSSSSGGTTAQTNPLTAGCSSADRSGSPTASSTMKECDQTFGQSFAARTDHSQSKADAGSWSLFNRATKQIATLLTVEAEEIDLDAPVAVLVGEDQIEVAVGEGEVVRDDTVEEGGGRGVREINAVGVAKNVATQAARDTAGRRRPDPRYSTAGSTARRWRDILSWGWVGTSHTPRCVEYEGRRPGSSTMGASGHPGIRADQHAHGAGSTSTTTLSQGDVADTPVILTPITKRVGAFWYDSEPTTSMIRLSIKREVSDLAVIDQWARSDARVVVAPKRYAMLRSGSVGTYFLGDIGTAHEGENKINVREPRVSP